jgi:hypothetical protein
MSNAEWLQDQRALRERQGLMTAVLAARLTLAGRTLRLHYHCTPFAVAVGGVSCEITQLRVRRNDTYDGRDPDTPVPPSYDVHGYASPLKADGTRDKRRRAAWIELPDAIGPAILLRAPASKGQRT